jgi:hypothetical protein
MREYKAKLIRFSKEATSYTISIIDGGKEFSEYYGGRYLVAILVGNSGNVYFLNEFQYLHPSYLKEKYSILSYRDAEIISQKLKKLNSTGKI